MALLNMDGTGSAPVPGGAADLIRDTDTANFTADVINASKQVPVIVDFWAPWCGPCKTLGPMIEKLVREYGGRVKLMKINVDENQELAAQMRVQSIPMVVAFKDGRPVDGFAGALPESQIRSFIERLTGGGGSPVDQALAEAQGALDEGDHETAMAIFSEVLQHDENNAAAHAGMARSLMASGSNEDAREYVDALEDKLRASKEVTAVVSALELAAEAAQAGDTGAADELRAKLAQNEDDHETRYQLALALYGASKSEEAVDELITIIKKKRDWNEDAARKQLLKIFEALGFTNPITVAGRRKLSAVLFS
ncbi:MAG: putative thioredoxin [Rhodospirillales bacterium]|jgi:putative thioredoxin|nr:putative thioredoxin [Rhodospirillales bacterium]